MMHRDSFKAKVVLIAINGDKTLAKLAEDLKFIPTRFPNGSSYYRIRQDSEGEAGRDSIS
jgi:hypothetical protein